MPAQTKPFSAPSDVADIEESTVFAPKFDRDGLIPAVAMDAGSGTVLMLAYMNSEALQRTIETGEAHYWSRSRQALWRKGETSGEILQVEALLTDCDQDAIVLKVRIRGRGAACHTGRVSCFYRQLDGIGSKSGAARLSFADHDRLFDPNKVYDQSGKS